MSDHTTQDDYSGDVSPEQTWEALANDSDAVLVDCRTDAEWNYVGLPDLSKLGKQPLLVQWQTYPTMELNRAFAEQVRSGGVQPDAKLFFLCRSGVRSKAAAIAMTAQGYKNCYNVSGGFEGGPDQHSHRGGIDGWKVAGLPWTQR